MPHRDRLRLSIWSSKEREEIAIEVQTLIEPHADVTVWSQNVFTPLRIALEAIKEEADRSDFALFICLPDDPATIHGVSVNVVRDNVILELGLLLGYLGRDRVFIVCEPPLNHLPTDLDGLTRLDLPHKYDSTRPRQILAGVCNDILRIMRQRGPRSLSSLNDRELKEYLGLQHPESTTVLAHCDAERIAEWQEAVGGGITPPGNTLARHISEMFLPSTAPLPSIIAIDRAQEPNWTRLPDTDTYFVVDSPAFNPYTRDLMVNRTKFVWGAVLIQRMRELSDDIIDQELELGNTTYRSSKYSGAATTERRPPFGLWDDFLVIAKMPGTVIRCPARKTPSVVWVVYGITAKGSHAGAHLFIKENFADFVADLRSKWGIIDLPLYFEALFKVNRHPDRVESYRDMECLHFSALDSRCDPAPLPEGMQNYTDSSRPMEEMPISSLHLDLVAGCNVLCHHCNETDIRSKGLYLTTGAAVRILSDVKAKGCRDLRFYGGEPTLHPDLITVLHVAKALGFRLLLVTNGTLLAQYIEPLCALKDTLRVRVSLDADSQKTYVANHAYLPPGTSFTNICQSIVELIGRGIPVTVSYLMTEASTPHLRDACEYWKDKGLHSLEVRHQMGDAGEWREHGPEITIIEREEVRFAAYNHDTWVEIPEWYSTWARIGTPPNMAKEFPRCWSGYYRFVVSPLKSSEASTSISQDKGASIFLRRGTTLQATNTAWISLCAYRRYNTCFGCTYPRNLGRWCDMERVTLVNNIRPSLDCSDTLCSRAETNKMLSFP